MNITVMTTTTCHRWSNQIDWQNRA